MKNILWLEEMGCNDESLKGDIKNHRIRVIDRIDIHYGKDVIRNFFFEFTQWTRYNYRNTDKRTGRPLKHTVKELMNENGLHVNTQYEKETFEFDRVYTSAFRHGKIEEEIHGVNLDYTKQNILDVVNTYSLEHFDKVCLIEEETRKLVDRIGAYREKEIIKNHPSFSITMWTPDYKVVKVTEHFYNPYKVGESFEVELQTGRITG